MSLLSGHPKCHLTFTASAPKFSEGIVNFCWALKVKDAFVLDDSGEITKEATGEKGYAWSLLK